METLRDEVLEPLVKNEFPSLNQGAVPPGAIPVDPASSGWTPPLNPSAPLKHLAKKRRAGSPLLALIPPLFFGGLFVLFGAIYWYLAQPSFEGEATATVIDSQFALTVTLDGQSSGAPREEFLAWMQQLFQFPVTLVDKQALIGVRYLSRDGQRLTVLLEPGANTELVQVPIMSLKSVAKYYDEHADELDEGRQRELTAALTQVCHDWAATKESEGTLDQLSSYTESLAFNAHVRGLGRVCEAEIGSKLYPCIGENSQQELVFLVPQGTHYFVIQEKREHRVFPSRLRVEVTVNRPNDPQATQLVKPDPAATEEPPPSMESPQPGDATSDFSLPPI